MIPAALALAGYLPHIPREALPTFVPPVAVLPWAPSPSRGPVELPAPKPRTPPPSPGVERVHAYIATNPGARQQEIAGALRISVSRTSRILRRLTRADRVRRERDGYVAS